MGTYKVGDDGNAPKGLSVGDNVVTGGGTWQITGLNNPDSASGYYSQLVNPNQTTYNYTGTYDTLPSGNTASGGSATSQYDTSAYADAVANIETPVYQAPDTSKYENELSDILAQMGGLDYEIQNFGDYYTEKSLDDYINEALTTLEPQYTQTYTDTNNQVLQNLANAGLIDSVYGQAMLQAALDDVNKAKLADATVLAQTNKQNDYVNAYNLYNSMIGQKQYETSSKFDALNNQANILMNQIAQLQAAADSENNFNLSAVANQIAQYQSAVDAMYKAGVINQMEYENALTETETALKQAQTELTKAELAAAQSALIGTGARTVGSYTGSSDNEDSEPDFKGEALLDQVYNNSINSTGGTNTSKIGDGSLAEVYAFYKQQEEKGTLAQEGLSEEVFNEWWKKKTGGSLNSSGK